MLKEFVMERVMILRTAKKVSARDMSLSLGMSENYINHLENGKLLPSLEVIDYICDYFHISIHDFFSESKKSPILQNTLLEATNGLQNTQIEILCDIATGYKMINNSKH